MSKVICDICGTSFPDTATQCPICGSVRPADAPSVSDDGKEKTGGYKHVKGGNFSKSNVRKRNKAKGVVSVNVVSDMDADDRPNRGKSNKALVILAVVLLLAIVAVAAYIILNYFGPSDKPAGNQGGAVGESTPAASEETIPCEELLLSNKNILFESADGTSQLLDVEVTPANTTDLIRFSSEDESIASVSDSGLVTPVGPGKTKIIVECGQLRAECVVECFFDDPNEETTEATTDATEESTAPTIDPNAELKLNRMDITFSRKDETWVIYNGSVPVSAITWSSDNDKVASIKDGKVVAVGPGMTNVYGEYNGQKVSCIIRCDFKDDSSGGVTGNGGGVTEDGGGAVSGGNFGFYSQYGVIHSNDTTISVGDSLQLSLRDGAGNPVSVTFTVSGTSCALDGSTVTGNAPGTSTVSCVYQGVTYTCTVRVN